MNKNTDQEELTGTGQDTENSQQLNDAVKIRKKRHAVDTDYGYGDYYEHYDYGYENYFDGYYSDDNYDYQCCDGQDDYGSEKSNRGRQRNGPHDSNSQYHG